MTITKANSKTPGVRFFYVTGDSGKEYVVAHVRHSGMNRWTCCCPDFIWRRQTRRTHRYCKHVRSVLAFLRISKVEADAGVRPMDLTVPLAASLRVIEEARIMGRTVEDHLRTRRQDAARLADLESQCGC